MAGVSPLTSSRVSPSMYTGISPLTSIGVSPTVTRISPLSQMISTQSSFEMNSFNSTPSRSREFILRNLELVLRILALLFSFGSSTAIGAPLPSANCKPKHICSFGHYPDLRYCFAVGFICFAYSSCQVIKWCLDLSFKGRLVSEKIHECFSFITDQLMAYLLVSSTSTVISRSMLTLPESIHKAAVVSACLSSIAFVTVAISALLSGFKLCKRFVW